VTFDVAIIGAGASGTLTAIQYARTGAGRGALIEAGARAARGLAYGTPYGAHLLNVPAERMSALPDDPGHFVRWLRARNVEATFAPRALYGDYLAELLEETGITRIGGTAVGLMREDGHWLVALHDDRTISARNVVLALGNLPPYDPLPLNGPAPAEYVRDPWARGAAVGLDPEAPVLLLGSGLTALDVAVALRHHGHRGRVTAVSRHGRAPQRHAPYTPWPLSSLPPAFDTPRGALRWICAEVAQREWRTVVDSIRPHAQTIWRGWSLAQRASFLRHARNLWDVHRHRAAPEVQAEMEVVRGRIVSIRRRPGWPRSPHRPRHPPRRPRLQLHRPRLRLLPRRPPPGRPTPPRRPAHPRPLAPRRGDGRAGAAALRRRETGSRSLHPRPLATAGLVGVDGHPRDPRAGSRAGVGSAADVAAHPPGGRAEATPYVSTCSARGTTPVKTPAVPSATFSPAA
jgi:thioredoxin reductase